MTSNKVNLLDFDRKGMRTFFSEELGEKAFRADQVMKWIYHFGIDDFDNMTNLNKKLREKLHAKCVLQAPTVSGARCSAADTIKCAMNVGNHDDETFYIPVAVRATFCVTSQAGRALDCKL